MVRPPVRDTVAQAAELSRKSRSVGQWGAEGTKYAYIYIYRDIYICNNSVLHTRALVPPKHWDGQNQRQETATRQVTKPRFSQVSQTAPRKDLNGSADRCSALQSEQQLQILSSNISH